MRALLVVNPNASSTHARSLDRIRDLLASRLDLTVSTTARRGHATAIAAEAAAAGATDLVIALGGDGTINEVVNGLLHDGPAPDGPALAVLPGGHANVLAHALGLPKDAGRAAKSLLTWLEAGHRRVIGLGRADERWFTFNAGLGIDAAVVAGVEDLRDRGLPSSNAAYTASLVKTWVSTDRHAGTLRVLATNAHGEQESADSVVSLIVQNTRPWTMLGDIAVEASVRSRLESGLDLVALRTLSTPTAVRIATGMLTGRGIEHADEALVRHDLAQIEVTSTQPVPLQVDGDLVGEVETVTFRSIPSALTVVAPPPPG